MKTAFYFFLIFWALGPRAHAQQKAPKQSTMKNAGKRPVEVPNVLKGPTSITVGAETFTLSWSSQPSQKYCKEEFSSAHENADAYNKMLMLELNRGPASAEEARTAKIREMQERKKEDRVAAYDIPTQKITNEILLSFMLSAGTGNDMIVEWNCYRYSNYKTGSGEKGIYLFAMSRRGYGKDVPVFLEDIKKNKQKYINEFLAVKQPVIKVN